MNAATEQDLTALITAIQEGTATCKARKVATTDGDDWVPAVEIGERIYFYNPPWEIEFAKDEAAEVQEDIMAGEPLELEDWCYIDQPKKRTARARRTIEGLA